MLLIALTGGIGSGKSTVSEIFSLKNIPIIDTDIIARQIVEQDKPAYHHIIKLFGNHILDNDNNIDRNTLRNFVFSSSEKRLQLEKILHPIIWEEVNSQISQIQSKSAHSPPYCIIVVPLLIENLKQINTIIFDRIIVIDVDEDTQIKRAMKRDNCDEDGIKKIMDSQVSRKARNLAADDIIINDDKMDSLNLKIDDLHAKYLQLSMLSN